jgi:hypothetical protein
MHRDDRAQAGLAVLGEHDALVRVESRVVEHRWNLGLKQNVLHYPHLASRFF